MSLRNKSIKGFYWSFLDLFVNKGLYFFGTLIMARLLTPADFGLIGMMMLFISLGTTLVDGGMSQSLVRSMDVDNVDYFSVFLINMAVAVLIYFILYVTAPYIAVFYNQKILSSVIRIYSTGILISTLRTVQYTILIKKMAFRKITLLSFSGNITGFIVGIVMAFFGYGVWSIVYMFLVNQVISTVFFWTFSNWKIQFVFSIDKVKKHFNFGYKLTLSTLLNTVFENSYNVLIGKYYTIQQLGFYERSYTLNNYPVSILSGIVAKVTFPMLAHIQEDKARLKDIFRKLISVTFFGTAPLMLIFAGVAKPLILFTLGPQWIESANYFAIMSLGFALYPIHSLNINLLTALGRSDLFLKLEVIKKILVLIIILVFFNFGISGLLWSTVVSSFLALFINTFYAPKLIGYNGHEQFSDLYLTLLTALAAGLLTYIISINLHDSVLLIQIILPSFLGGLCYLFLNFVFKNKALKEVILLIQKKTIA